MSVLVHDMMYRDGAISSAIVIRYRVCDTEAELFAIPGNPGDLAYCKDTICLYAFIVSSWAKFTRVGAPNFTGDINVTKTVPKLILDNTAQIAKGRFAMDQNPRIIMSYNLSDPGGTRDDNTKAGNLWLVNDTGIAFWSYNGAWTNPFRVESSGAIFEYGRSVAKGVWTDIPYSSGNFLSDAGTWTVSSGAALSNRYTLIGKTCIHNVYVYNSSYTGPAGTVHLRILPPSGITIKNQLSNIACPIISSAGNDNGLAFVFGGTQYIQIRRSIDAALTLPTSTSISLQFQLMYEIT